MSSRICNNNFFHPSIDNQFEPTFENEQFNDLLSLNDALYYPLQGQQLPVVKDSVSTYATDTTDYNVSHARNYVPKKTSDISSQWKRKVRKLCSIQDCPNFSVSRSVCISHGTTKPKICKEPGCSRNVVRDGVCISHGARPRKACMVENCINQAVSKNVCSKHGAVRTKCFFLGCSRFAQRNGKCVSHGAKLDLCSVDKCDKKVKQGGLCSAHGAKRKRKLCQYLDCANQSIRNGVCVTHGANKRRCLVEGCLRYATKTEYCGFHAKINSQSVCKYEGCTNPSVKKEACSVHLDIFRICRIEGCSSYAVLLGHCIGHMRGINELKEAKRIRKEAKSQEHCFTPHFLNGNVLEIPE